MKNAGNTSDSLCLLIDQKLESRFDAATIERGLHVLAELGLAVRPNALTRLQARYKLGSVARHAEDNLLTVIHHKGVKLVLISAHKLFDLAEQSRLDTRAQAAATR